MQQGVGRHIKSATGTIATGKSLMANWWLGINQEAYEEEKKQL
jgi:hypothetical protein